MRKLGDSSVLRWLPHEDCLPQARFAGIAKGAPCSDTITLLQMPSSMSLQATDREFGDQFAAAITTTLSSKPENGDNPEPTDSSTVNPEARENGLLIFN